MNRIASVMVMQARDRATWLLGPWIVLGAAFVISLLISLSIDLLWRGYNPSLYRRAGLHLHRDAGCSHRHRSRNVSICCWLWHTPEGLPPGYTGMERRVLRLLGDPAGAALAHRGQCDQELGRGSPLLPPPFFQRWLAPAAVLLVIPPYIDLSCAHSDPNYVSGGSSPQQLWVSFVLLLFMYLLGLLLGSIYQRFGRTGEFFFFGVVFLLLSVFVLLSSYWQWWGTISGWFARQTATALGLWLVPLLAIFALASYALLRKATV